MLLRPMLRTCFIRNGLMSTLARTPSILEFTSCSSYLRHIISNESLSKIDWKQVQSEIIDTKPAFDEDEAEIDESPMAVIDADDPEIDKTELSNANSARLRRFKRSRIRIQSFNVDFFVLDTCERLGDADAAVSYLNFVGNASKLNKEQKEKLFKLAIRSAVEVNKMSVSQDMKNLLSNQLDKQDHLLMRDLNLKNYREVNSILLRTGALVLVDRVSEANTHLKKLFESRESTFCQISPHVLVLLASKALLMNDLKTFWRTIKHPMFHQYMSPLKRQSNRMFIDALDNLFDFYVDHVINLDEFEERINYFIQYMGDLGLFFSQNMKEKLEKTFKDNNKLKQWNVTETTINDKGKCECSGHQLPLTVLSHERLRRLEEQVMSTMLESQIYSRSNPKEIENFKSFLATMGKFDVVIDGLNVAIKNAKMPTVHDKKSNQRTNQKFMDIQGQRLITVLKDLHSRGLRKPLLIYRPYLRRLPNFDDIKRLCKYVLFNRHSDDDIFTLITAMRSGPSTFLLSNDQFRPYNVGLDDSEMSREFVQWQIGRQIRHDILHGEVHLQFPPCFDVRATAVGDQEWLVPMQIDWSIVRERHSLNIPQKWIWMRKKQDLK